MITVFGYVRLSDKERDLPKDEQEKSLINQKDLMKSTCKKLNQKLITIFEDKYLSGGDRDRPAFNDMINRAKKGACDRIMVKDKSRFCRDSAFFKDTLVDLRAYGIEVYSVMDNRLLDPDSLEDSIGSIVDERVIIENRKKTKILFGQKQEKGLPVIRAPFGYKFGYKLKGGKKIKTGKWIIAKHDASIVKKIFDMTVRNEDYKDIMRETGVSVGTYYRIIENIRKKIYSGYVVYNKKIKDSSGRVVRTDEVCYKGVHDVIIDEEELKRL